MKKRTKTQNNAQELFTLMTDMELWNFLVRGHEEIAQGFTSTSLC